MRNLKSARYFWELFSLEQRRPTHDPLEHKRYLSLLGFTAIEGALAAWWESVVLPHWGETLSLVDAVVDSPEELQKLLARGGDLINKGQLLATLRFIKNTGEPERFSPNLVDVGCALLILSTKHNSESHTGLAKEFLRLQRLRNLVFHVGRGLNELEAHEAVKSIKRVAEQSTLVNPLFSEAFPGSETSLEDLAA
jgi:hypothetical protein